MAFSTSRMTLPYPGGTDTANVPADIEALANRLAAVAAGWLAPGVEAAIPAPAAALDRFLYFAYDTSHLFICVDAANDGTYAWLQIPTTPEMNTALAGKANTVHTHSAADVNAGVLALARLPVAASGAISATAVVRADDTRLSDARPPIPHGHAEGDIVGLVADLAAKLGTAGGTVTGDLAIAGRTTISGMSEASVAQNATGAVTLNALLAENHVLTLVGNVTSMAIANVDGNANRVQSINLILIQDATGGRTVTWPAGTKWPDGVAPALSTSANAINVLTLMTYNGGATWLGFLSGRGMA